LLFVQVDLVWGAPTYSSRVVGLQVCNTTPGLFVVIGWGLTNFSPGLALNCNSPHLHLPNSWDYKCELCTQLELLLSYL
jgi:hypothetical protein